MGSISGMIASYRNNRELRGTKKRLKDIGPAHVFEKTRELSEEQILKNKKAFSEYNQQLHESAYAPSFIKIIQFFALSFSLFGFIWLLVKLGPLFW